MTNNIRNIEEIKAKVDVHSTLEYLGVDTQGQKMICCPLHGEKTPSFGIYRNDKLWNCLGACSTGGDSIRLVQLYKDISYHEAVQEIGNLVGIQPEFSNMSEEEMVEIQNRSKMERILEPLNKYFVREFWEKSDEAKEYLLNKRMIYKNKVVSYELGYAPYDYTEYLLSLIEKEEDITLNELVEFGLLGTSDKDNPTRTNIYCRLRNCIVIPNIISGRIVGFIGRNIDENDKYKYIKVGYTDHWDGIMWKSGEKQEGYLEGKDLHLFEGQMDGLTVIQCGLENVWTVNGVNSLTPKVINLINKMNPNRIYVHPDWDEPGDKARVTWAEKLGYKGYIVPPQTVKEDNEGKEIKDVNRIFTFLYEQEKNNLNSLTYLDDETNLNDEIDSSDETVFNNVARMIMRDLKRRIEKAENLIIMEFNEWKELGKDDLESIKNDKNNLEELIKGKKKEIKDIEKKVKKSGEAQEELLEELTSDLVSLEEEFLEVDEKYRNIESEVNEQKGSKLQSLLQLAYSQYKGNAQLLELFKKDLMAQGITSKVYESMMKNIIKDTSLVTSQRGQGLETPEWEVIDGVLCKNVFDIRDGEFKPVVVTTTVPVIDSVLVSKDGKEEVLIKFTDSFGVEKEVIVGRRDLLSPHNIINSPLGEEGFKVTHKNASDIVDYLQYLESQHINLIKLRKIVETTGYHNDEIYIGRRGEIITKDGILEEPNLIYISNDEDKNVKKVGKIITREEWKELNKDIFPKLLQLNEMKNSLAIISWYLASICKVPFQEAHGKEEFSLLNIYGVRGSGKTTLATFMQRLLGGTSNIKLATDKMFGIMKGMSLSNAFPLILDEYKLSDMSDFHNNQLASHFKAAFNSNYAERGRGDQSSKQYPLINPTCIIGENALEGSSSDAVNERGAVLLFSKNWVEKNVHITDDIVRYLNKQDLSKFYVRYLMLILELLDSKRFEELFEFAEDRVSRFCTKKENGLLKSRHITTLKILSFGVELLKEIYNISDMDFNITQDEIEEMFEHALSHALNNNVIETSLDRIISYFATNLLREFTNEEIICDFGEKRLYIWKSPFIEKIYTHSYQNKMQKIGKSALNQYLEESMNSDGYVTDLQKVKKIGGIPRRCIVFDIMKLDELAKIEPITWLDYGSSRDEFNTEVERYFNHK